MKHERERKGNQAETLALSCNQSEASHGVELDRLEKSFCCFSSSSLIQTTAETKPKKNVEVENFVGCEHT